MRVYSRFMDELACVCATLRRTTRAIARVYDQALAPFELRTTEYSLLAKLDQYGPIALTPFAGRLGMDRSTLTRELRPLQAAGLVEVGPGRDRRQRVARLTDAGEQALASARPAWQATQAEVAERFGGQRTAALLDELRALTRTTRAA
jgi:DNA-binding MarR family transcriptional regulator